MTLELDLKKVVVNREQERILFKNMIDGVGRAHIFLIQAEGGMGKSSLLREFSMACEGVQCAQVNLKLMSYSISEILGEICHQLGPDQFDSFYDQCENFARTAGLNIERSTLIGTQIEASLGNLNAEQRKFQYQVLTDTFFENLRRINTRRQQPIVLIFDTYEASNPVVKEWLDGLFLTRVRPHRWLIAVVAGRAIPDFDVDWAEWCLRQTLRPLDKDNVREFVRRIELTLSEDEIGVVYDTTDGKPLELAISLGRLLLKRGRTQ